MKVVISAQSSARLPLHLCQLLPHRGRRAGFEGNWEKGGEYRIRLPWWMSAPVPLRPTISGAIFPGSDFNSHALSGQALCAPFVRWLCINASWHLAAKALWGDFDMMGVDGQRSNFAQQAKGCRCRNAPGFKEIYWGNKDWWGCFGRENMSLRYMTAVPSSVHSLTEESVSLWSFFHTPQFLQDFWQTAAAVSQF